MPSTASNHISISDSPSENGGRQLENPGNGPESNTTRSAKRLRVALACQRCKKRKQKCDGHTPACSNCRTFNADCLYVKPSVPRSRDSYLRAADDRIAELEGILFREGISDDGQSQWRQFQAAQLADLPYMSDSYAPELAQRPSKRPCTDNSLAQNDVDMECEGYRKDKNANAVVDILRDLSLEASGGYIGASSSITMSRMVGSLVKSRVEPSPGLRSEEHLSPKSSSDGLIDDDTVLELGNMPESIADKLLKGYLKHISTRWPILHSNYIRTLHHSRGVLIDPYEKAVLHLVYASGARFLETTGETGAFFPDQHHSVGMQYLDQMLQYHDIRTVQILILLAIYSLRAPKGPGAWSVLLALLADSC